MKKKLCPLHIILSTITCASISLSAQADEYQLATYFGLIDNNAYTTTVSAGLTYYFDPVDDSHGPKSLAPLLNKSSGVNLNYKYIASFPSDDSRDNIINPTLNINWVFDNNMYVEYHQMFEWTNYRSSSSITTDKHGNKFTVGYIFDNESYLEISDYATRDNKQNYYNSVAVSGGHLFRLENDKYIYMSGKFSQFINDDHNYDGESIKLSGSFFLNTDLGIHGSLESVNFRAADSNNIRTLGTRYFFSNTLSASLTMERGNLGDFDYDRHYMSISKRF